MHEKAGYLQSWLRIRFRIASHNTHPESRAATRFRAKAAAAALKRESLGQLGQSHFW
jgi:hypothetical protein